MESLDKSATVFAADMHLMPGSRPEQDEHLHALLQRAAPAARLILLGDTFNCWFERDGQALGDFAGSLSRFAEAAEAGLEIHHVCGNRDFVVGAGGSDWHGFFKDGTPSVLLQHGITPHGPGYTFQTGESFVHCTHGDTFCTGDRRYQALRSTLQGSLGRLFGRWVPLACWRPLVCHVQEKAVCNAHRQPPAHKDIADRAVIEQVPPEATHVFAGHVHYGCSRKIVRGESCITLTVCPPWTASHEAICRSFG